MTRFGHACKWMGRFSVPALLITFSAVASAGSANALVDFQRDVRPILSGHCFKCHGPDAQARKANLRLDTREEALRPAKSGARAVVPGKADESRLIQRIFSADEDELMPPPDAKRPLTEDQKQTLKRWIAAGAQYTEHWGFIPPEATPIPAVRQSDWPQNPIDNFVFARLEKEGLRPSPKADKYTLVRRLYLDLIGFPPTPEEVDAFVSDSSPRAYEKLVDQLLASAHYGERWARHWLDLARYADTNGYEKDRRRSIWPYRDWVINALNSDMPFDQFTIEQIAGDMLPNASISQRIATGFHRNTMLNEEGGIDPLEFRFHAMVDRVNTTATAWLGLTMACAQCHTHKYDPIPRQTYYEFMAFLNNADEVEIEVPVAEIASHRAEIERKIATLTADLPNQFPAEEIRWHSIVPAKIQIEVDSKSHIADDGSVRIAGTNPKTAVYRFEVDSELESVVAVQMEFLSDPSLPQNGPGRSGDGDAVLSEVTIATAPRGSPQDSKPVTIVNASADFTTKDQPIAHAIDGKKETGWLVRRSSNSSAIRTAAFYFEQPGGVSGGTRWIIQLDQEAGKQRTFGRLRLSLGTRIEDSRPLDVRRHDHLEKRFSAWLERERARAVPWVPLRPVEARSNLPLLTILDDDSVLASGDQTKSDTYELKFRNQAAGSTAIRVEAIPDERLPNDGPGRVYYEGPIGDFTLSEISMAVDGKAVRFGRASHSYASGQFTAQAAIDGNPQTGWSVDGGQGRSHSAVFNLESPVDPADELSVKMVFERHFSAGLGRFRIWATTSPRPAVALQIPSDIEGLLHVGVGALAERDREVLLNYFVMIAPELADARKAIDELRKQMPPFPTTLVMAERPRENPRATFMYQRGEFLQPAGQVKPEVPQMLHSLPHDEPRTRLTLARWLVDRRNPLVGRVVMNRHWAAFFGTGLVRTLQDFGFQGEVPSHPELLDWLALEFSKDWSMKKMHRLIVTSSTYQQSSRVTPELLEKDPRNLLLARAPRIRLNAELIRDTALRVSGLLSAKIGGPSVFPPQPPGVTTEGTYGPLEWKTSEGEDRYRRGLYTFAKRTAPYAMFHTFDAPTGEACVARREVSNTPLQALTLMNDIVFVEAAQALGRMAANHKPIAPEARAARLYRRCLGRPPNADDLSMLIQFYKTQKHRFEAKELDPEAIGGVGEGDSIERAAWTTVARALLNLDRTITVD